MQHPLIKQKLLEFIFINFAISIGIDVIKLNIFCILAISMSSEPILQEFSRFLNIQVSTIISIILCKSCLNLSFKTIFAQRVYLSCFLFLLSCYLFSHLFLSTSDFVLKDSFFFSTLISCDCLVSTYSAHFERYAIKNKTEIILF